MDPITFRDFYTSIEEDAKKQNIIANSFMDVCSVSCDLKVENLVNVEMLIDKTSLWQKRKIKEIIDQNAQNRGIEINYVNLSGDL